MSFKAKDLQFDNSQPAFLRRLRGELTGEDATRHERPIPRNMRMKQDDEDDAPTYVLEDTNQSMTKEEYEAFISNKDSKEDPEHPTSGDGKEQDEGAVIPKDKIAEVGAKAKKRKIAKVIGDEQEQGQEEMDKPATKAGSKVSKKLKKKSKAVKLTFGDEEG